MKIELSKNKNLGGILIKSNSVTDKEVFFRVKQELERALGSERILGKELSYQGYHPFDQEPTSYQIRDTIRGSDLTETKVKTGCIVGLQTTIII